MTEKESLALITEMISRTKERYIGDGNIMLMWGYLTVCVSVLVWVMIALTHNPVWNYLWFSYMDNRRYGHSYNGPKRVQEERRQELFR